jgi:hypothetical protein
MAVYKSPGVFVKEFDISIVKHSKRYSRRIKIGKIFDIDVPNVIVTSTPKGRNYIFLNISFLVI